MKQSKIGLARIIAAFFCSLDGFKAAYKDEAAFRQEIWLVLPAAILACFLDVSGYERLAMIASLVFVLIVELLNTGIENLADKISPEFDPYIKKAKDVGSAAVLLALGLAGAVWAVVLL